MKPHTTQQLLYSLWTFSLWLLNSLFMLPRNPTCHNNNFHSCEKPLNASTVHPSSLPQNHTCHNDKLHLYECFPYWRNFAIWLPLGSLDILTPPRNLLVVMRSWHHHRTLWRCFWWRNSPPGLLKDPDPTKEPWNTLLMKTLDTNTVPSDHPKEFHDLVYDISWN